MKVDGSINWRVIYRLVRVMELVLDCIDLYIETIIDN